MESKITTDFEAKTEQKINYPADFGGLSRAVGKFFWTRNQLQNLNFEYTWSLLGHVVLPKNRFKW